MSLQVDDLNAFKLHKSKISNSLSTKIIGRDLEINEICQLIKNNDYVAIAGPSGAGKSRLAVAAIEKYCELNCNIKIICTNFFTIILPF